MALNQDLLIYGWSYLRALEGGGEGACPVLWAFAQGATSFPANAILVSTLGLPDTYDPCAEGQRAACFAEHAVTLFAPTALCLADLEDLAADLIGAHACFGLAGAAEVAALAAATAQAAAAECIVHRRGREAAILMIAAAAARCAAEAARSVAILPVSYAASERSAVAAGASAAYAMRAEAELSDGSRGDLVTRVVEVAAAARAIKVNTRQAGEGAFAAIVAGLRAGAEIASRRERERQQAPSLLSPPHPVTLGATADSRAGAMARRARFPKPRRLARRVGSAFGLALAGSFFSSWWRWSW